MKPVDLTKVPGRPCKGCGRKLYLLRDENGKTIPLDAVAPTWRVYGEPENFTAVRTPTTFVSHFATCGAANEFSAAKRGGS
jgi:hypothetical protein